MLKSLEKFYSYFEERPLGEDAGTRRRNVTADYDLQLGWRSRNNLIPFGKGMVETRAPSAEFTWRATRALENRNDLGPLEGVWATSYWRCIRFRGDPGRDVCPELSDPKDWPDDADDIAKQYRLHHAFRIRDRDEAIRLASNGEEIRLNLRLTTDWYDSPGGVIPPFSPSHYVGNNHAVPVSHFNYKTGCFVFSNSWGPEWGDSARGYLHSDYYADYVFEAWRPVGQGLTLPITIKQGLVELRWKTSGLFTGEVHGREIVAASTGDRIAWAFLRSDRRFLELEDFFVWPTFRRRGYGHALARMVLELEHSIDKPLKAWVPYPDCLPSNEAELSSAMRMLNLHLDNSPVSYAGYVGIRQCPALPLQIPRLPKRPASTRDSLKPKADDEAPVYGAASSDDSAEALGSRIYRVWFATNRLPEQTTDLRFSDDRSTHITHGYCDIVIPKSHRFGSIGSSWWQRLKRWDDDRLSVQAVRQVADDLFWLQVQQALMNGKFDSKDSLIFIHGYNVSFEDAAIRAAQIGFDLKIPGVTGFFSWPSQSKLMDYPVDEATIEASESHIADYIIRFAENVSCGRLHILAHSMGNRGLLRAIHRIVEKVRDLSDVKIGQIILAAPDVDADLFRDLASVYPTCAERTTLYASSKDSAIKISKWLHKFPRAGLTPPITIAAGVDTVLVPQFNVFELLGHGYYAEAAPVLHDVFDLIRRNAPPHDRQRIEREMLRENEIYWRLCE